MSKVTMKPLLTSIAGCSKSLDSWLTCTECKLHKTRRQVVLGRGVMPAKVLFIGEAPGVSEDVRGIAFIGKAGNLLNKALAKTQSVMGRRLSSYCIINVLGCLPVSNVEGESFRKPEWSEVIACRPRLKKILTLVQPRKVIFLGKVAEEFCKTICPDGLSFRHPSYLNRIGATQSTEYAKFVRDLVSVFRSVRIGR